MDIIDYLFPAPAWTPPTWVPKGAVGLLVQSHKLMYLLGVKDGFVAGALLATLVILGLTMLRSRPPCSELQRAR